MAKAILFSRGNPQKDWKLATLSAIERISPSFLKGAVGST